MRALTRAGALAAAAVGTGVLLGTDAPGMLALGAFFIPASLISRIAPDRSAALDAKGSTRDPWQVLANGAAAAIGAQVPGAGLWIVTAALAAAAADTWATSVGGWSRRQPRDIRTFLPVPPGASGGITPLGCLGAAIGAIVVGIGPALVTGEIHLVSIALSIGMLGMLGDSLLGATLQGRFHCDSCDRPTERRIHRCGAPSRRTGGLSWLSTDGFNAVSTSIAAFAGWLAWRYWAA